uniref:HTH myb-type domain-containing protein n=1 Tax=Populus davidiana TaxID=266767 RepID=A0A6M2EVY2_9ROSI
MDFAEKMQRCHEYVEALEEERRKIQVFERELPLCLELVTQAIEACKRELSGTTEDHNMHGQSECSEQTSSEGPVLEEFIPIKRTHSSDDDETDNNHDDDDHQEQQSQNKNKRNKSNSSISNNDHKKKSDWLRSVQLWNQSPDPPQKQDLPRKAAVTEVKRNGAGGAFQPFHREKSIGKTSNQAIAKAPTSVPASTTSSTAVVATGGIGGGSNKKEDIDGGNQRKQRRCWSPELHRRFLHALRQLGGSHAATPKQIRELMKVDGLTNDEVKSHLQKYRLHTRRPSPTIHNNSNQQAPQFVVVGGIWVPPPEYAAVAATTASAETPPISAANGIYAPIAAAPPAFPQKPHHVQSEPLQSEGRGSHSEGGAHSNNSPATSSSTHTTTTSPVF